MALTGLAIWATLRRHGLSFLQEPDQLVKGPDMIGDTCCDGRRGAEALVDAAEVVVREVEADRRREVFELLAEGIGQASEATRTHAEGEVQALDVRSADVLFVRRSGDHVGMCADAHGRRVLRRAALAP